MCKLKRKHMQDLYAGKYKIPMGEINKDVNKWKDILCYWKTWHS